MTHVYHLELSFQYKCRYDLSLRILISWMWDVHMFDFRYKYQKAVEGAMKAGSLRANGQLPRVRTDLYSISFEDDR